jgi:hypothetical protein
MINFCTVADSRYLLKGLAMYNSLVDTMKGEAFTLHWLCLDDQCYDKLLNIRWELRDNIDHALLMIYKLSEFEKGNEDLRQMKANPATMFGDSYSNYCWSLTPWFIDYVLNNQLLATEQWLVYVDSDIVFYQSPMTIIDVMDGNSVGIHTHRFTPPMKDIDVGWYNVGVMVFRNDWDGKFVADMWKGWLIDTTNPYYKTHGKTGDQKYLELFATRSDKIRVFDEGTNITHLAPWCANIDHSKAVAFFHFSHFTYDLKADTWSDSLHGEWNPAREPGIIAYYEAYFEAIKEASRFVIEKISIIGNIRVNNANPERIRYLVACLKSFEFLKDYCEVIINFECPNPAIKQIQKIFNQIGFEGQLYFTDKPNNYGYVYTHLLEQARYDYVLNFLEDHFCVLDSPTGMQMLLRLMREKEIEVMKTSFHEIELASIAHVSNVQSTVAGTYFLNDQFSATEYSGGYQTGRFYIGVNFLTTKAFARKFWQRDFDSNRPHEWEISEYTPELEHSVLVPAFPVLASIDDDHGEPGSCLLKKSPWKWKEAYG